MWGAIVAEVVTAIEWSCDGRSCFIGDGKGTVTVTTIKCASGSKNSASQHAEADVTSVTLKVRRNKRGRGVSIQVLNTGLAGIRDRVGLSLFVNVQRSADEVNKNDKTTLVAIHAVLHVFKCGCSVCIFLLIGCQGHLVRMWKLACDSVDLDPRPVSRSHTLVDPHLMDR